MRIIRRIFLVILLTIPAVKYAQARAEQDPDMLENQAEDVHSQLEKEDFEERRQGRYSTSDQVNRAGTGRVYVYYGTGHHRPYHKRRYYYNRKGYPYSPYSYRYYHYPYQRPSRFYKRGGG